MTPDRAPSIVDTGPRPDPGTRLGFWAALATAVTAVVGLVAGVTTPARSGPNCLSDCITSPYTDAAAFVPRDYLWMYPVVLMVLSYVVVVACVHHAVDPSRRVLSQVALAFSVVSASVAVVAYGVQLMVVQPALLQGELDGLSLWSMYNPHGLFIALENVTYLLLGVSFLFLAAALPARRGVIRAARVVLALAGVFAVAALPGFAAYYRSDLDYRYEVAGLSIAWIALTITGVLLAIAFRRRLITPT